MYIMRRTTSLCVISRIHGSYQALVSGFANEALVDFTAGIAEQASLLKLEHPHRFFRTMKRAFRRGSLLTCSAPVAEVIYIREMFINATENRRDFEFSWMCCV